METKKSFFRRSDELRREDTIDSPQTESTSDERDFFQTDDSDDERPARRPSSSQASGARSQSYPGRVGGALRQSTDREDSSSDSRGERDEASRYGQPDRDSRGEGNDRYARTSRNERGSEEGRDTRPRREYGSESGRSSRSDRGERAPRGERADFRRAENRRPEPERDAPENVIFGVHPVREALEMEQPIEKLYFKRHSSSDDQRYSKYGSQSSAGNNDAIDAIRAMAKEQGIVCQDVPAEKLDRLTRRNNHQGVVAVVPAIEYAEVNEIIEKFSEANVPPLVVVLDGITDVRNFGAIARSAECAGADAIIISAKSSAPVNAEAMKSAAGALSIIPVCRVGSIRNTLKTLQMSGVRLIAATEKADKILFEADFVQPTAIIMGAEDRGISGDILRMCDDQVSIPLLGKIESLNVSAAAAVLLFEVVRQRFNAE